MLIGAVALSGCVLPQNNQHTQSNQADLRSIVASDRQQINALQDEVSRLNDHIAEMEHNGEAGGRSSADKARLAELEHEVEELKSDRSAPTPMGAGSTTDFGAAPSGPPGSGAPVPEASPPRGPSAMGSPAPASGSAMNAPSNDNADSDSDNSDDSADNRPEVASAGPPPNVATPPAAARLPGPPMVAGSPSWRAVLNQELATSQSSRDAAAKVYRAGLTAMKAGKYPNAIGVFQGLQRKYPKSPLSEPAEYFSANALFELGKYDQSILQFNDLVMRFPRGRFASTSLLNEAQAFMKMNDRIDARLTLQKLLSDHPDAPEASTARGMMSSLANG